jgi:hypothetical protein
MRFCIVLHCPNPKPSGTVERIVNKRVSKNASPPPPSATLVAVAASTSTTTSHGSSLLPSIGLSPDKITNGGVQRILKHATTVGKIWPDPSHGDFASIITPCNILY